MSDLYWPSDAQMAKLKPFFPKSHGNPPIMSTVENGSYRMRWMAPAPFGVAAWIGRSIEH